MVAPHDPNVRARGPEGMVQNLIRFSHLLRSRGIRVPFTSTMEAVEALQLIDLGRWDDFHTLLRSNFISRVEDLPLFDELFRAFWLSAPWPHSQGGCPSPPPFEPEEATPQAPLSAKPSTPPDPSPERGRHAPSPAPSYSPKPLLRPAAILEEGLLEGPSNAFEEALERLLARIRRRRSRRYTRRSSGPLLSLRWTLRRSIPYGGELLKLEFRRRRRALRRILFLGDISGSMDIYTLMALQFIHALRRMDPRTEIFLFSTALSRVTPLFDTWTLPEALRRLPRMVRDWGGGTRIGHCLRCLHEGYGSRLLTRRTVVIIFSDGWDRGDVHLLSRQMAALHRRVHRVLWINPLAGTEGYQPICRGMQAALPYVDALLPLCKPADLEALGGLLERMIG